MPRAANPVATKEFKISTTNQIWQDLCALSATGRFGKTPTEVAESFVRERVRHHTVEGWLEMPSKKGRR